MTKTYNVSSKEGGRGVTSNEDCEDVIIQGLEEYSNERRIPAANMSKRNVNIRTNRKTTKTTKQRWEEKHGYFKRQIGEITHQLTCIWLKNGNSKEKLNFF